MEEKPKAEGGYPSEPIEPISQPTTLLGLPVIISDALPADEIRLADIRFVQPSVKWTWDGIDMELFAMIRDMVGVINILDKA